MKRTESVGGSAVAAARRSPWQSYQAITALLVLVVDQVTKLAILVSLELQERVTIIPGFFDLVHALNRGGVWGLGRELSPPLRTAVFLALPAAVTGFALWYGAALPKADRLRRFAISLVVGGAIGNLIDRWRIQGVVDFLVFHVGERYWPAFNVADSAICVGIFILVVATVIDREEIEELATEGAEAGGA